ncbi:MAG: hypothetical protein ACTS5I_06320, partial [Rhodanobacter sp.]
MDIQPDPQLIHGDIGIIWHWRSDHVLSSHVLHLRSASLTGCPALWDKYISIWKSSHNPPSIPIKFFSVRAHQLGGGSCVQFRHALRTMLPMKILFAGTPEFAAVALQSLHQAGFEIALVLSQPDRPAGRGMQLQASPVKQYAMAHGIAVAQPASLRLDGKYPQEAQDAHDLLRATPHDVM